MTKLLALLTALTTHAAAVHAEVCAQIPPAARYQLTQVYFTYGTDMVITSKGKKVGAIVERKLNVGRTFELLDAKGRLVARAERRLISLGAKVDIYDCHREKIGSVHENVMTSMFRRYSVYSILDAKDAPVAQSTTVDFLRTSISFDDAAGVAQGRLVKAFVNVFRDSWSASFVPNSTIDQRLLLFAAAYKTSADDARKDDDEDPLGTKN